MVYFSEHELHYVEVVGAEADDEGEKDEENDRVGPVVSTRPACHGVPLGSVSQFQVDLGVAAHDDGQWTAERDDAGQNQEVRGEAGSLKVKILHAGAFALVQVKHTAEQQRSCL